MKKGGSNSIFLSSIDRKQLPSIIYIISSICWKIKFSILLLVVSREKKKRGEKKKKGKEKKMKKP